MRHAITRRPLPAMLTLAALCAALCAAAVYLAASWAPPDAGLGPRLRFEQGVALRYALRHESQQTVAVPELGQGGRAPSMTGRVHLEGALVLRGLAPEGGRQRFALRFEDLTAARIEVQGQPIVEQPLEAAGEAVVELRPTGEVLAVRLPADAPPAVHAAVHLVLAETQVRLGDGDTWQATETTAHGAAPATYRRGDDGIERRRGEYTLQAVRGEAARGEVDQTVDSRARFTVEAGRITALEAEETLEAHAAGGGPRLLTARSQTRLTLLAVERAAPVVARPLAAATRLGAPIQAVDAEGHARRQRIGDLTADRAREMMQRAAGGRLPEHNKTLWRLTALLREDPALCAWMGAFAGAPGRTEVARALALDLLTSAGTSPAQAALRSALDAPATQAVEGYAVLYQRAALLTRPDGETLTWLAERHAAPGPEGPAAAAMSLGAAAGAAARGSAPEAGRAQAARLLDETLATDDPVTRSVMLRALGNAARPEHAPAIAGFAGDADPDVRRATATALRRLGGPEAHGALMDLALDGDARVQGAALTALGDRPLAAADLERLAAAVTDGTLAESSLDRVVERLVTRLGEPAAHAVLDAILSRPLRDSRIKGRIRSMLGT